MKQWVASVGTLTALGVLVQQNLGSTTEPTEGPTVSIATVGPMPPAEPDAADRLRVVPVAPFPSKLEAAWQEDASTAPKSPPVPGCPVSVRAIIAGDAKDGFAMVDSDGESLTARRGESFPTPAGKARVVAVKSNHITLTGAFGTVRCALDTERN